MFNSTPNNDKPRNLPKIEPDYKAWMQNAMTAAITFAASTVLSSHINSRPAMAFNPSEPVRPTISTSLATPSEDIEINQQSNTTALSRIEEALKTVSKLGIKQEATKIEPSSSIVEVETFTKNGIKYLQLGKYEKDLRNIIPYIKNPEKQKQVIPSKGLTTNNIKFLIQYAEIFINGGRIEGGVKKDVWFIDEALLKRIVEEVDKIKKTPTRP